MRPTSLLLAFLLGLLAAPGPPLVAIAERPGALPAVAASPASGRQAAEAPAHLRLPTRWSGEVRPDRVLPEYPRPQLVRARWQSLNGPWGLAVTSRGARQPEAFRQRLLVPFAVESALGGVARTVRPNQHVWYRRTFTVDHAPAEGERVLLHFGAVDWEAVVSVNGRTVGEHRGGYDPFSFDVTDALRPGGEQELVVRVWDPTDTGPQPRGKQVRRPESIWYTAVTGIWQTVWLETVPATYVERLQFVPDPEAGRLRVHVHAAGAGAAQATARLTVLDGERRVAEAEGAAGTPIDVTIPSPRRWSPSDPFLYGVHVRLSSGDAVESYAGLRTIAVRRDTAGVNRLFLNGEPLFQYGLLDQGWWPDGLYTAPTDEALRYDVEMTKRWGFNMIRKHVKVEPARWYYHCDTMGVLVWQDMPSGDNDTPAGREQFRRELARMVEALGNHPSIVMWVPFNEGWGQHDTERVVDWLTKTDPTRLVNNASGWTDRGVGHVNDVHVYPGPGRPPAEEARAAVLGEFGGLGLPVAGHTWERRGNWGYRTYRSTEALLDAYRALLYQLRFQVGDGLAAAVYTQTTDVEIEVNGLMTYDRAVAKLPVDTGAAWHAPLYGPPPRVRDVLPTGETEPQPWRYTTRRPPADWHRPEFDASAWKEGRAGFGRIDPRRARVRTPWTSKDIWLRRTFELTGGPLVHPHIRVFHDDAAEIFINGRQVATLEGHTEGYVTLPLDPAAAGALQPGTNTIAVHVHQDRNAQFVDVGLVDVVEGPSSP